MLKIIVPKKEFFNEATSEFFTVKEHTLMLEHSLVSISKWESIYEKSFIDSKDKTNEEVLDYIKCMTLTQNVDPLVYEALTKENFDDIGNYISAKRSGTTINDRQQKARKEILTSELIYYYMIAYGIPFECEKWHLNRLLMLIQICSIKNGPTQKMSRREILSGNASLNAARRKAMSSKG